MMKHGNRMALGLLVSAMMGSALIGCGGDGGSDAPAAVVDGTIVPKDLQVPTLAYDDTSVTLVWKKPDSYSKVVDYRVYQDGKLLGLASANNSKVSPAKPYIDQFYKDDVAGFHVKMQIHNYLVDGLKADTSYKFTVRAVLDDGTESADSVAVVQKTAAAYANVVDLAKVAFVGDTADSSTISANTAAIQKAIDDCAKASTSAYGCKVTVPAGKTLVSGALFLRSNMTFEIPEGATLKGSPYTADYPLSKGYQLYSYVTNSTDDRRPPSLLNLLSADHLNGAKSERKGYDESRGVFANVRVVGKGILDCNGWTRLADITGEKGAVLAQYSAGNGGTFAGFSTGVLAKSQMEAAVAEFGFTTANEAANKTPINDLYSNRRSSMATFRGVKNMYFGGLTLRNPAFHGVMFLESQNVVFANTASETFDINNGDGVEFGNTDGALVFNNFFDTGDDNVNFAAGQGKNYEKGNPTQNVWVFNNYMREGHGVLALGSHTGAWIQDILAEDNVAYLTDNGLRMKSTPATGGGARRITFRDNAMRSVGAYGVVSTAGGLSITDRGSSSGNAFIFTLSYSAGTNVFENASASSQFRDITVKNISLDNVDASKGGATIKVDAYAGADAKLPYPETFHENLSFDNVRIKDAKPTDISRLKGSKFNAFSVNVGGAAAAVTWWAFKDSNPGNTFTGVTPLPSPLPN